MDDDAPPRLEPGIALPLPEDAEDPAFVARAAEGMKLQGELGLELGLDDDRRVARQPLEIDVLEDDPARGVLLIPRIAQFLGARSVPLTTGKGAIQGGPSGCEAAAKITIS